MGQLLSPMPSGLLAANREVSAGGAIRLADEIAELAITAALEEMEPGDTGSRNRNLYTGMLRYIEAHVDTRFGETAATTIRTRRLEACRQAMLSPHSSPPSVQRIRKTAGQASGRQDR
jgi:hypothetical protein